MVAINYVKIQELVYSFYLLFVLRFHQIRNKDSLEYSANSETKTDVQIEEKTEGRSCGLLWNRHSHNSLTVTDMCVSHYTHTCGVHYRHTRTQLCLAATQGPLSTRQIARKLSLAFPFQGIAFGQGKSIFTFSCI